MTSRLLNTASKTQYKYYFLNALAYFNAALKGQAIFVS